MDNKDDSWSRLVGRLVDDYLPFKRATLPVFLFLGFGISTIFAWKSIGLGLELFSKNDEKTVSHLQIICLACGMKPESKDTLCLLHCPQVLSVKVGDKILNLELETTPIEKSKPGVYSAKLNDAVFFGLDKGGVKAIQSSNLYRFWPDKTRIEVKRAISASTGLEVPMTAELVNELRPALEVIKASQIKTVNEFEPKMIDKK